MTDKRALAFVSPRFLFPTDSGGKIRTTQILRGLKGNAFDVTLLMPSTRLEREQFAGEIDSVCDELISWDSRSKSRLVNVISRVRWLWNKLPIPVRSDWDSDGAQTVSAALDDRPDAVVFDFPHSAVLAPDEIPVASVMFTHNIETEIFKRHYEVARFPLYRWIWRNQYRKMRQFERSVLSKFDCVVAVSERDRDFFCSNYEVAHCGVIPTVVDTDFFEYASPGDRPEVVFCGSMDWLANIDGINWFFDEVWPAIHRQVPNARMKVVGRSPPDGLVKRIRSAAPEWEFTGFVDDVRKHVCGAAVFVIPLRVGGGTRIKAFEAMAMGTPVVSTTVGIEGLPVVDGDHYLEADAADEFAARVVSLLQNRALQRALSATARQLVEDRHGLDRAATVFEKLCLETIARRD